MSGTGAFVLAACRVEVVAHLLHLVGALPLGHLRPSDPFSVQGVVSSSGIDRPGFTIEAGEGENPLPIEQFPEIYRDNLGILVTAALGLPGGV